MTEKLSIGIADAEKGTNEVKALTGAELTAHLAAQAQAEASDKAVQDKIAKDDAEKAALLERLGITADEAKLLLG
jgi:hypothetical protein